MHDSSAGQEGLELLASGSQGEFVCSACCSSSIGGAVVSPWSAATQALPELMLQREQDVHLGVVALQGRIGLALALQQDPQCAALHGSRHALQARCDCV